MKTNLLFKEERDKECVTKLKHLSNGSIKRMNLKRNIRSYYMLTCMTSWNGYESKRFSIIDIKQNICSDDNWELNWYS
jgi:hypothetical protein